MTESETVHQRQAVNAHRGIPALLRLEWSQEALLNHHPFSRQEAQGVAGQCRSVLSSEVWLLGILSESSWIVSSLTSESQPAAGV